MLLEERTVFPGRQSEAERRAEPAAARNAGPEAFSLASVRLVRGREAVLALEGLLKAFAETCQQPGAMSDLRYFLDKPGWLTRRPVLLLATGKPARCDRDLRVNDLRGALLMFEYRVLGLRTGVYTSSDRSGASALLSPAQTRVAMAALMGEKLLAEGAQVALFCYRGRIAGQGLVAQPTTVRATAHIVHAQRDRVVPDFLSLGPTYEATLAGIGQRTRSNMRYYRRRAEKDLGCVFEPQASLTEAELQAFNRDCMYAVGDQLVRWRFATLACLEAAVLAGIQDGQGRWIAILGGRRQGEHTEILWQMNRGDLPGYSVSLVLRSYLIEHEIGRGATRLSVEGGTPHPISQSFQQEVVTDVLRLRVGWRTLLILRAARHIRGISNELLSLLVEPTLWHTAFTQWLGRGRTNAGAEREGKKAPGTA